MADADPPLVPGPDGTPLPPGLTAFRLTPQPRPGQISAEGEDRLARGELPFEFFALSSADRAAAVPHLSAWCDRLTTVAEAWALVGAGPDPRYVLTLPVDGVRGLGLDVCWFRAARAVDGGTVPETRPGHAGHCGVTGLEAGGKNDRRRRRVFLADLAARQGVRLVPPPGP